jgi:hypothetical protein
MNLAVHSHLQKRDHVFAQPDAVSNTFNRCSVMPPTVIKSLYSFSAWAIRLFRCSRLAMDSPFATFLLTPVIEAKFSASRPVARIHICFCGVWLLVDKDCNSADTICRTTYMKGKHTHLSSEIICALTGKVRDTNLPAPAVPRILNPMRHIESSSDLGAFLAEKVGI